VVCIDATGVLIIDATDPTPIPPAHKWLPIMLTNRNSALGVTSNAPIYPTPISPAHIVMKWVPISVGLA